MLGGRRCHTGEVPDSAPQHDLAQVAERGAPAQRAEAQRLAAILGEAPDDVEALEAARHLVDAYLNDPYLERDEEPRQALRNSRT